MSKDIDKLPFTAEGYENAKAILEAEYGQPTEIVNSYIKLHYYLAFQKLINHLCIRQLKNQRTQQKSLVNNSSCRKSLEKPAETKNEVKVI